MLASPRQWFVFVSGTLLLVVSWLMGTPAEPPAKPPTLSPPPPASVSLCQNTQTETAPPIAQASVPAADGMPQAQEAAIREILEFRQQHQDLFHGTLLQDMALSEADEEFRQALQDVVRRQHPQPTDGTEPTAVSPRTQACEAAYLEHITEQRQVACQQDEQPSSGPTDAVLVSALRQACRQLDDKANELEDFQLYAAADQLRALSSDLRRQARKWAPPVIPPSARQAALPAAVERQTTTQ